MKSEGTLQHEIGQKRRFTSAEEAVLGLLRTADVVRRRLVGALEAKGITFQQYNVLRILRGAGAPGCPTLEVASRMIEEAPGITRLLDRLEAKRLVARERCPQDRRQVTCRITPLGLDLLSSLDRPMLRAAEDALGGLSSRRTHALIALLDAVRATPPTPLRRRAKEKQDT